MGSPAVALYRPAAVEERAHLKRHSATVAAQLVQPARLESDRYQQAVVRHMNILPSSSCCGP